ncbi:MAG TPA: hypothetical protein VNA16_06900 [Abditibacteriaceae bacterium]|nr:hypothetical protein [Abditibacteriaceae bacterium]
MSDQPPRDPLDEKNKPIGPQRSMSGQVLDDDGDLSGSQAGEIKGSGATDRYSNDSPEKPKGEDIEKIGSQSDDAMGAGQ